MTRAQIWAFILEKGNIVCVQYTWFVVWPENLGLIKIEQSFPIMFQS